MDSSPWKPSPPPPLSGGRGREPGRVKTSTWRWLLSPITSVRAVRLLRSGPVAGTFNDAWVIARLTHHPEEAVFLPKYTPIDSVPLPWTEVSGPSERSKRSEDLAVIAAMWKCALIASTVAMRSPGR
jgi:hypothetical protein